jgi:hypothetical protein
MPKKTSEHTKRPYTSPKEIIESDENPSREKVYLKFPGKELQEVTGFSSENITQPSIEKIKALQRQNNNQRYNFLHTHPVSPSSRGRDFMAVPSQADLYQFMWDDTAKYATIVVKDARTGEVEGNVTLKKTARTPEWGRTYLEFQSRPFLAKVSFFLKLGIKKLFGKSNLDTELIDRLDVYKRKCFSAEKEGHPEAVLAALDEVTKHYALHYKIRPAEGYRLNEYGTAFVPIENHESLHQKASPLEKAVVSIIVSFSALLSIMLSQFKITGFAISAMHSNTQSIVGIMLFVFSLCAFLYFRERIF